MAEKSATNDDAQSNKAFQAGFEGPDAAPATADKPEKTEPEKPDPKPEAKADDPPKKTDTKAEKPKAPEHVQITKDQFDKLLAAADETASLKSQMSKAFGTIGNMQQLINKLQESTPKGEALKLPDDVVDELKAEFPELAGHIRSALEKALKAGVRGTGDSTEAKDNMSDTFRKERIAQAVEELEDAYPDWKEIVGAVNDGKFDPKHPFRAWLATQPEAYQQKVNETDNSRVIERAIDRFKAAEAEKAKAAPKPSDPPAPSPKAEARRSQLRKSTNPRGSGPEPTRQKTPEDHFREGFSRGD